MIDITGVDLTVFVKKAYELSRPQGMGFLHYVPGPLSDAEAAMIVDAINSIDDRRSFGIDYVNGRAVKMCVFKNGNRLEINDEWYDHTPEQLNELLDCVLDGSNEKGL